MDPNATMDAIKFFIAQIRDDRVDDDLRAELARDLAEAFENLYDWINKGGSPPAEWLRFWRDDRA